MRYNDYASVLNKIFPERVQKITVNAGLTCPNRDGSKGWGGCSFCNNQSFSPSYCSPTKSVKQQIVEGIEFFKYKYTSQNYLAYFQSYSNTYAQLSVLKSMYEEALSCDGVVGLVIGTRPDCVSEELLDYLADLSVDRYIMIEYGIESTNDEILRRVNRGHTFEDAVNAIEMTKTRKLFTGAHFILGLPGETKQMILDGITRINRLPIDTLKLHQLQLIKGTAMEEEYLINPGEFKFFELDDYLDLLVMFIERLNPAISIERFVSQSPDSLLIRPKWGIKNFEFTARLQKLLQQRDTYQGKFYISENDRQ
jgi:radical SAM protein (TIGR01212 family)